MILIKAKKYLNIFYVIIDNKFTGVWCLKHNAPVNHYQIQIRYIKNNEEINQVNMINL
jgi:hypothetical protein